MKGFLKRIFLQEAKEDPEGKVIEIAKELYEAKKKLGDLAGMCHDVSTALGKKLLKKGFESDLVCGHYVMDSSTGYHYWLEFNKKVLDLTCEQFSFGVKGKKVDPIFLKAYTKRHTKDGVDKQFRL